MRNKFAAFLVAGAMLASLVPAVAAADHTGNPATAATGNWVNCFAQKAETGQVAGCVATDAAATTSVTVDTMIELDGVPSAIAFGHGVPYAQLNVENLAPIVVTTNAIDGYTLDALFTEMDPTVTPEAPQILTDVIPTTSIKFAMGSAPLTYGALTAGAANLATTDHRSDEAGDSYQFNAQLNVPFVNAGDYAGTATFTATTL